MTTDRSWRMASPVNDSATAATMARLRQLLQAGVTIIKDTGDGYCSPSAPPAG